MALRYVFALAELGDKRYKSINDTKMFEEGLDEARQSSDNIRSKICECSRCEQGAGPLHLAVQNCQASVEPKSQVRTTKKPYDNDSKHSLEHEAYDQPSRPSYANIYRPTVPDPGHGARGDSTNPITILLNILSIRWFGYLEMAVAMAKIILILVMIICAIMLSNYAHQNRRLATNQGQDGQEIPHVRSSEFYMSSAIFTTGNDSLDLTPLSQHWMCGRPQLSGKSKEARKEALYAQKMAARSNVSSSSIPEVTRRPMRHEAGGNGAVYPVKHNVKMQPVEDNIKISSTRVSKTLWISFAGSDWRSTCNSLPLAPQISLHVAVMCLITFIIATTLHFNTHWDVRNQFVILSALFQSMAIWFTSQTSFYAGPSSELEFVLLAILPWCIVVPTTIYCVLNVRQGGSHKAENRGRTCAEKHCSGHHLGNKSFKSERLADPLARCMM